MTTIINPQGGDSGAGVGMILGVVLVLVILVLFFVYGLPALRGGNNEGTNINIPDDINVTVDGGSNGQ
jgi:hypothetical protein